MRMTFSVLTGLKANVVIDRNAASRLGVAIQSIDAALNSAFGQRQDSLIYTQRNQYRVVIEVPPSRQRDPRDLSGIYVSNALGGQVPLQTVAQVERQSMPLIVNHQGVVPRSRSPIMWRQDPLSTPRPTPFRTASTTCICQADCIPALPATQPTSKKSPPAWRRSFWPRFSPSILFWAFSTKASSIRSRSFRRCRRRVLARYFRWNLYGLEFTVIAFIGILLLIGIVKKNGIMLVDFALHAERDRGLAVHDAALEAAKERFRPILMTTLAAIFGALPLAFASGVGAELRRPLGITIVGGLILSQVLTLYTTPVIYLLMSKLHKKRHKVDQSRLGKSGQRG